MTARPDSRPAGLEALLAALRVAGLPVAAHEILRLHQVFALAPSLAQEGPPDRQLRDLLAAALTHDPGERQLFDQVYAPWAERWGRSLHRRAGGRPDLSPVLEPGTAIRRRPRPWSRLTAAKLLAAARLPAVALLAVVLSHAGGYQPAVSRNNGGEVVAGDAKEIHTVWLSPSALVTTSTWLPDWPPLATGAVALLAGALALLRYRRKSWIPAILAEPLPGPPRLPLLPSAGGGPELLDAGAAETLIWGVDRHLTERLTAELDLEATARETARSGGLPELRFEPEQRLREVWLWLDGTADVPRLERWAEEIARSLERAGLPVRIGGFDGVPDELMWDEGQCVRPVELEGHRQTALVAVCTDGEVLQGQLAGQRRAALRPLLSSLAAWQRLAVVDFSAGGKALAEALGRFGISVVSPARLPAFFGLGAAPPAPAAEDPGEVRAWRAALALGGRPIDRPTAYAVRRALGLELSPWACHLLEDSGDPADQTLPKRRGGRLLWSDQGRATLIAWLAEGSLAEGAGLRAGSLLDRALDFWQRRLAAEAAKRAGRAAVEPWADRPAERFLAMERALLRLWRRPTVAAEELFELGAGELAAPLAGRLGAMAPRDCRRPGDGLIPLPWRLSDLGDRGRYLLAERGLGGLRRGALERSGRLGLGLGVLAGAAAVLFYTGGVGRTEQATVASGVEVAEAETPPDDGRNWIRTSWVSLEGGTFRMGSEDDDALGHSFEKPAHEVTVGGFRMGQTEVTNAQYRAVKPDHPGDDDRPAVDVSWFEARDYCRSLGQSEDWEYDLPTEAEWEYATRAGTTTAWSFGDDESQLDDYAWFRENSGFDAHEVASKKPNPWGLYDVHGNVWEWVLDCWAGNAYEKRARDTSISDPGLANDSCHQSDTTSGALRVLRGGAFISEPGRLRSAFRFRFSPEVSLQFMGFRCVRRARPCTTPLPPSLHTLPGEGRPRPTPGRPAQGP